MQSINRTKGANRILRNAATACAVVALSAGLASPAMASGLDTAKGFLDTLKGQILTIVPIIAVISMLFMGVFYAMGMMRKETLVHWFIGVALAGSAAELVSLFFSGSS